MKPWSYYNEICPQKADWIRELIKEGVVANGEVDTRSIADVSGSDVRGFTQCHWFAGIAVWSYSLRCAGWPDDRPCWTGSCPCTPFSSAGNKRGFADERHLWPEWFRLIEEFRPITVFGEQVEAAIKHGWLDTVQADMEGIGYAVGACGLPAAGFGAPHQRHRLYFVGERMADSGCSPGIAEQLKESWEGLRRGEAEIDALRIGECGELSGLGESDSAGSFTGRTASAALGYRSAADSAGCLGTVANTADAGHERRRAAEASNGGNAARTEPERFCSTGETGELGHTEGERRIGREDNGDSGRRECSPGQAGEIDRLAHAEHDGQHRPAGTEAVTDCHESGKRISERDCAAGELGNAAVNGIGPLNRERGAGAGRQEQAGGSSISGFLEHPERAGLEGHLGYGGNGHQPGRIGEDKAGSVAAPGWTNGFWSNCEWIWCRDGKYRPVEPVERAVESSPQFLAPGTAADLGYCRITREDGQEVAIYSPLIKKGLNRVLRLKGFGDGLCAPVAEAFIRAYLETKSNGGLPLRGK